MIAGLLEGLQVWFCLHDFHVMLSLGSLVEYGEPDVPLKWPGQLPVKISLHGMDEEGDVVGTARGVGALHVQTQTQLVAWTTRVETGAVLNDRQPRFLVAQESREIFEVPDEDTVTLLRLQFLYRFFQYRHPTPELCKLPCL